MHSQAQDLQRYLDGELGPAARLELEHHLAECAACRANLAEWQALTAVLQSWTLPPGLARLPQPLSLPARETRFQIDPGLLGWTSGLVIVLFFVLVRGIFWVGNELNWALSLTSLLGFNGQVEQFTAALWSRFAFNLFYLSYAGELGQEVALVTAIVLPLLLYVLFIGAVTVLYVNWFSLTFTLWGGQTK